MGLSLFSQLALQPSLQLASLRSLWPALRIGLYPDPYLFLRLNLGLSLHLNLKPALCRDLFLNLFRNSLPASLQFMFLASCVAK